MIARAQLAIGGTFRFAPYPLSRHSPYRNETRYNQMKTINMNDLDKALRGRYPISNMDNLGFLHLSGAGFGSWEYFESEDCIVKWDSKIGEFWTYPRANYRKQKAEGELTSSPSAERED